jgi:aminoglycoside/choline kinase family phosphotransferase
MELNLLNLKKQISEYLGTSDFQIEIIPHGASIRRYYRLRFNHDYYFPTRTVVLMQVPSERSEIADDYLNISYYLRRHGIARPRVYEIQRNLGWIFMEHGWGTTLDIFLQKNSDCPKDQIYRKLLDFLIILQEKARFESHCPAFNRKFDHEKYTYEFGFHVREQLLQNYFGYQLSSDDGKFFHQFSEDISRYLSLDLMIFVHRDFQSSNIFYQQSTNGNNFQIIDFQDARSGHPLYDLVSLLWDSYVDLSTDLVNQLVQYFYDNHPFIKKQFSSDEYLQHIDYLVIQRKLHDAGAFAYTYFLTQNDHYIHYIKDAILMALSKIQKYKSWEKMAEIFQNILVNKNV